MKSIVLSVIGLTVSGVLLGVMPAFAQSEMMTDQHIARIKTNCEVARATLGQIHANDAPAYINRNQTYFSVSDKLMARLNSRLAFSRYNTTDLVKTASDYSDTLAKFRTAYKSYDDLMSDAVHTDCIREPVGFYDKVASVRDARQNVHDLAVQLTNLISQYHDQVQAFESKNFSSTGGKS